MRCHLSLTTAGRAGMHAAHMGSALQMSVSADRDVPPPPTASGGTGLEDGARKLAAQQHLIAKACGGCSNHVVPLHARCEDHPNNIVH